MSTTTTPPTPPTPGPDKLTTVGTTITTVLQLLTPIATVAAGAAGAGNLAEPIGEAVGIAVAALQKLLAEHNVEITLGDLEALRLTPAWPDPGAGRTPAPGTPPAE